MGLLQNGYRQNLTSKIFGLTNIDGWNPTVGVYNTHRTAANRNSLMDGYTDNKAAVPNGNLHPSAWIMPNKAGGMSARTGELTFTTAASILGGKALEGSVTLTITTNTPEGQLVSTVQAGGAPASFSINTNTPLLTASLNANGSTTFTFTFDPATLGAEASVVGDALITISGTINPAYAIGHMEGTTDVSDVVTNASVAKAVWDELLAAHQATGSAGEALAAAGSGGVNYTALAQAVWEYVDRELTSGSGLTLQQFLALK